MLTVRNVQVRHSNYAVALCVVCGVEQVVSDKRSVDNRPVRDKQAVPDSRHSDKPAVDNRHTVPDRRFGSDSDRDTDHDRGFGSDS